MGGASHDACRLVRKHSPSDGARRQRRPRSLMLWPPRRPCPRARLASSSVRARSRSCVSDPWVRRARPPITIAARPDMSRRHFVSLITELRDNMVHLSRGRFRLPVPGAVYPACERAVDAHRRAVRKPRELRAISVTAVTGELKPARGATRVIHAASRPRISSSASPLARYDFRRRLTTCVAEGPALTNRHHAPRHPPRAALH